MKVTKSMMTNVEDVILVLSPCGKDEKNVRIVKPGIHVLHDEVKVPVNY